MPSREATSFRRAARTKNVRRMAPLHCQLRRDIATSSAGISRALCVRSREACRPRCSAPSERVVAFDSLIAGDRPPAPGTGSNVFFSAVVLVHRRDVHDVLVGDEAVAGVVQHRRRVRRFAGERATTAAAQTFACWFAMWPDFGIRVRDLDRVAEHVDVLHLDRLERQEVDFAPAVVRGDDARRARDRARAAAAESRSARRPSRRPGRFELRGSRRDVDVGQHVIRAGTRRCPCIPRPTLS